MITTNTNTDALLEVTGLQTYFPVRSGKLFQPKRYVRAVDGVDFRVRRGKTLGLVGESGSGKTTVGRTILRLIPATAGRVVFDGQAVFDTNGRSLRTLRQRMQIIFQDPVGSLNPRMTVADIVREPLDVHSSLPRADKRRRVYELLERVGLSAGYAERYPHEFSGGQRQRIGIARALASDPEFIVCDEPVSALDVSIQAQILNLLSDLQDELGLSYLFIAHNLAVVEHFADEVAVMYLGRVVEIAGRDALYSNPLHPYTRSLLASVPQPDPANRVSHAQLPGEVPSPINPPSGCPFHPRCPLTRELAAKPGQQVVGIISEGQPVAVMRRCTEETPKLTPVPNQPSHCHACFMRT
ncbi:MAG: ATP-binding cassette domain-containing protein [Planctomycetaceae bacterium]|nr:MAG: ATP-binding cassette domain-containing protein [Planctomycetaceae bacterium]